MYLWIWNMLACFLRAEGRKRRREDVKNNYNLYHHHIIMLVLFNITLFGICQHNSIFLPNIRVYNKITSHMRKRKQPNRFGPGLNSTLTFYSFQDIFYLTLHTGNGTFSIR